MKLLLDENIPISLKKLLKESGYDVEHINDNKKGMKDKEVFKYAVDNKQCIITYDIDYKELRKQPHYGIIKIEQIAEHHQQILLKIIEKYKNEDLKDIYIYIGKSKVYKEIKKYTKKTHIFKQFHRIPLEVI